jgi:hypothetical protein
MKNTDFRRKYSEAGFKRKLAMLDTVNSDFKMKSEVLVYSVCLDDMVCLINEKLG